MNMTPSMTPTKVHAGTDALLDLIQLLKDPDKFESKLKSLQKAESDANFRIGQLVDAEKLPKVIEETKKLQSKARIELEEATEEAKRIRQEASRESDQSRLALDKREKDLDKRETTIKEQEQRITKREKLLTEEEQHVQERIKSVQDREQAVSEREVEHQKKADRLATALGD